MAILCEPNQELAAYLRPSFQEHVLTVTTLPELAMALVQEPAERVVVIGPAVDFSAVLSFAGQLRAERPDARIVLLRDHVDPLLAAQATKAGVYAAVPSGYPDLLTDALVRAATIETEQSMAPPAPGRVATVFSAKGGSGKTTLATNLAVALQGLAHQSVCLVDLDLAFGDVAISMQLTPRRTLIDAVESGGPIDAQIDNLVTAFCPGLDCVLAPVEPGDAERIPAPLVTELVAALRSRYSYVVIDTPSQFSEHVLAALDASDHHVLLTTPEIPALKNLRLTLDMLDLLAYRHEARSIVLNRSDHRGGLSAADAEEAVHGTITAQVPASHEVPASINRGVPIVQALPDHVVSRAITTFAVHAIAGDAAVGASTPGRRGLRLRKRSG